MFSQERIRDVVESARRAKEPVYLVTALYVVAGFFIIGSGVIAGNLLAAFLGFLCISGALCAAVLFHTLSKLAERISSIGHRLDGLSETIDRIDRYVVSDADDNTIVLPPSQPAIDLTDLGPDDPTVLTAVTLNRHAFPRLVTTMEQCPPAELGRPKTTCVEDAEYNETSLSHATNDKSSTVGLAEVELTEHSSVANKNLLRQWITARREGDLRALRQVYSTLIDTAEPPVLGRFTRQLKEVTGQQLVLLRTRFSRHVREHEYAKALDVGSEIAELFPDQPVATDFGRLRPHLQRRLNKATTPNAVSM